MYRRPPRSPPFPSPPLSRSSGGSSWSSATEPRPGRPGSSGGRGHWVGGRRAASGRAGRRADRSEEHTSELQSRQYLVCRLLLEKKKINTSATRTSEYNNILN